MKVTRHCPNCGSAVEPEPLSSGVGGAVCCEVCGYRSERVHEYLWIYGGGSLLAVQGFAAGAAAFLGEGGGPEHWIHAFSGWHPVAPWPEAYTWLSFLVDGIVLTMTGIGITRRKAAAWWSVTLWTAYKLALAIAAAVGALETAAPAWLMSSVIGLQGMTMALLVRINLALRCTPSRDAVELQRRARQAREDGENPIHSG